MANLCLLNDDGSVREKWPVDDQALTIGRGDSVSVRIDDDGLSRRHFMVYCEGRAFQLKDLSSRNGTWLEGYRASTRSLRHNDVIVAGNSRFIFAEFSDNIARIPRPKLPTGPHDTVILPTVPRTGIVASAQQFAS